MSAELYDRGLRSGGDVAVRHSDGRRVPLGMDRWHGPARGADVGLLARAEGPVLDVGCGPGRLAAALTARGVDALGIDVAQAAVGLTHLAGGHALQRNVFGDVPGAGGWKSVVLADGNVGIGGDPVRLLRRVGELLSPDGRVLVELDGPDAGLRVEQVRLESGETRGTWFSWAYVGGLALAATAFEAGLSVIERWSACDIAGDPSTLRWFAVLAG